MRFKAGDKVRIISDLNESMQNVVKSMEQCAGKTATITEITADRKYYILDIDKNEWFWNEEFVKVADFTKADLKPCMVVVHRNGDIAIVAESKSGLVLIDENSHWLGINNIDENFNYTLETLS